ncbi:MAG: hypothetical protein A3D39_03330 [Candidatus Buchananbacteria bacterium RIFCSPHIGHO2_02_FULL_39_17]|uniref:Glycosyltransferase RgtA/B/C/D-like domain-containing protein n=1 Tax=Candidatus Buchananbacteria bacterium RIFCSPLOWO2_01_FULL_40_23b TaxID=1797544 RepID=A0A1G1YQL4_9BACT|nr:MAG: hypothetical protein A3D39_03330 [Candidatus Buchananbacteria bacterium RIFCSPHIGHO2_02_FULL_39_17]OGY54096.1 MAG: hypothetical protein A2912_01855 [Candidatus Buchananbacteria bacterium RIFCSPLOWO2_01_FULL_40_23b]
MESFNFTPEKMTFGQIFKSISLGQWRFVALVSLILIILTSIPIIYGWLVTPAGQVFTGMHFVSADDWFVYYSFINQAKAGKIFFRDLFAPVDHQAIFRPEWLAAGLLARFFKLPVLAAFQLFRLLLIPIFLALLYLVISYYFKEKQRRLSFIFLIFSSGLGTIFLYRLVKYPFNYFNGSFRWPMDLWVPDLNNFYLLYTSPHFILSAIFLFLIFFLAILFSETKKYSYALWSGVFGAVLFLIHPFQVIKVFLILATFFLLLFIKDQKFFWPGLKFFLTFLFLSLPAIFYYFWLWQTDWLTGQRIRQNINPTTPLYLTVFSFGGLLVGTIIGIYFLVKTKKITENKYIFLIIWIIGQLLILYAPINYQRRTGLGFHLPLGILTLFAIFYFYERCQLTFKKNQFIFGVIAGLIFLPSTIFVLAADLMVYEQGRELSYLDLDIYQSFLWLKDNVAPSSIILSAVKTGNVLPAYALRTSYVGHAVETPGYIDKKKEVNDFFANRLSRERELEFLRERRINYIFYGDEEKKIGDYQPTVKDYLKEVYQRAGVGIYQVTTK